MNLVRKVGGNLKASFRSVTAFALAAALVFAGQAASAQAALGSTGVDVGEYVTLVITALGAAVALIVGGYFAFLLIKKAMKWGNKIA